MKLMGYAKTYRTNGIVLSTMGERNGITVMTVTMAILYIDKRRYECSPDRVYILMHQSMMNYLSSTTKCQFVKFLYYTRAKVYVTAKCLVKIIITIDFYGVSTEAYISCLIICFFFLWSLIMMISIEVEDETDKGEFKQPSHSASIM